MRVCSRFALVAVILILAAGPTLAQSGDIEVGKIDFPKRVWGSQVMSFDVVNPTDIPRFLVVGTEVSFEETYATAVRKTSRNFILMPKSTLKCEPAINIPGNYGQAIIKVTIYDVVDTLDDLSLGQKVLEQPFFLKFNPPETVLPYRQDGISVPPLVDKSTAMDNELSRLILIMLQEGKTADEIAALTGADPVYVAHTMQALVNAKYLISQDGQYVPSIPVILRPEAEEVRKLAGHVSDEMVKKIKANWPEFQATSARLLDSESKLGGNQGFLGGVIVLKQPYVVLTGMFLWARLGSRFVNNSQALNIYPRNEPCEAQIAQYSYLVQGGDYYKGHHYFDGQYVGKSETLFFGDSIPEFDCSPGPQRRSLMPQYKQDTYQYDTAFTNPALFALEKGMDDIVTSAGTELEKIHTKYGQATFSSGVRLWFWDLNVSLVTDRLLKDGLVTRAGSGQYRYQRKPS